MAEVTTLIYKSAEDAEYAFYRAFEQQDIRGMMMTWDTSDDIVCVHPMCAELNGPAAIEDSWVSVFENSPPVTISYHTQNTYEDGNIVVHITHEFFTVDNQETRPMVTTNIFRFGKQGWRMVLHHASPMIEKTDQQAGRMLH